jgi:hypothetical protein
MKVLIGIFSSFILALGLTACGYDGHYRYPCQDPVNWESPECNPPLCKATGTCTTDLLGFDPKESEPEKISSEEIEQTTSDIIEEPSAPAPENVDNINSMVDELSEGN